MPIDIFLSYAHEDEDLMNDVRRQLVIFERKGEIRKWHDRMITPGEELDNQIDSRLREAQIILLFVSPSFIESKYCYDIEVREALKRHESNEAHVIPIILRPCAWEEAPFSKLLALPQDGRAVSQWEDRDQVCLDIAKAVMEVARRAAKR